MYYEIHGTGEPVDEIKEMLADVVKNQLAVIGMWLQVGETRPEFEVQLAGISESIGNISEMVDSLSEESLHPLSSSACYKYPRRYLPPAQLPEPDSMLQASC